MSSLIGRLGTRLLVVTVFPTAVLTGYLGLILAAGAPSHRPSMNRALATFDALSIRRLVALLLVVFVASIATHPLQVPLVQLLEGYWWGLPLGAVAAERASDRFRRRQDSLTAQLQRLQAKEEPRDWATEQGLSDVLRRLRWLPDPQHVLPTELGNVLRAGEVRAGVRYGLELDVALPRLFPNLPPGPAAELADRRNQLDAAVRLCLAFGVATLAGIALLLRHGPWLFLPLSTYLASWACYAAAVAAGRGFCTSLAAAVDLSHLKLHDSLQLQRPRSLRDELKKARLLMLLFRGEELADDEAAELQYVAQTGR